MTSKLSGKSLVAGTWLGRDATFVSDAGTFFDGTLQMVDAACEAAEESFWTYGASSADSRAAFLNAIADEIEARGAALTAVGSLETGLPEGRLEGERGRTTHQLRMFAEHILGEKYPETRHDPALPDRLPMPRPDLTLVHKPVGPVAVFGASNFPLAFSVAGGDTAAALAAGCPVVVKAHPAHPGTCEIVAEAVEAAIRATGQPQGTFSMIHGRDPQIGAALVSHPLIQAVGFTGSQRVGRILFDLCASRAIPIPFFGELGAINPVFVLPKALERRGAEIAIGWADSLTMGVGQFCTNPGVVFVPEGEAGDDFVVAARTRLETVEAQKMLTEGIADACRKGAKEVASLEGVTTHLSGLSSGRYGAPSLIETDSSTWRRAPELHEEVFGPHGLVVRTRGRDDTLMIARGLNGQLTAALHLEVADRPLVNALLPILERKAGRILANGFPTGVEVADAMVHGGPFPASTNFGATSVGSLSIRRFLRPVCYQSFTETILQGK